MMLRVAQVDEGMDVGFGGAVTTRFRGRMETEPRKRVDWPSGGDTWSVLRAKLTRRAKPTSQSSSRCRARVVALISIY